MKDWEIAKAIVDEHEALNKAMREMIRRGLIKNRYGIEDLDSS